MTINLEIMQAEFLCASVQVEELNTKTLVPKMVFRRRLTRAAKLLVEAVSKVDFAKGRIIYSSAFGELSSTANILNAIEKEEMISPTDFQNSVYNTPVSYLSILQKNTHEIMTLSSGDKSYDKLLKMGAIKALDGDEILLLATETLNIKGIEQINHCIDTLEIVVALKVRHTNVQGNTSLNTQNQNNYPKSIAPLMNLCEEHNENNPLVIEVVL